MRMIQKIAKSQEFVNFNQGEICFAGDSKKKEARKRKSFEVMCVVSQVLKLGLLFSQKHHDELTRNNFKFLRYSWDDLIESHKNEIMVTLDMIKVTVDEFKANTTEKFQNLGKFVELKLEGNNTDKLNAILSMLNSNDVPSKWRHKRS